MSLAKQADGKLLAVKRAKKVSKEGGHMFRNEVRTPCPHMLASCPLPLLMLTCPRAPCPVLTSRQERMLPCSAPSWPPPAPCTRHPVLCGTALWVSASRGLGEEQEQGSAVGLVVPRVRCMQVAFLAHVKHANIVPFVGSCDANHEQILVFEFIPNGSLSQWLRPTDGQTLRLEAPCPKPWEAACERSPLGSAVSSGTVC